MTQVFAVIRLTFVVKQHSYTYQCTENSKNVMQFFPGAIIVGGYNQQDGIKIEKEFVLQLVGK